MVEEDLTAENTFNWLRETAEVELVPEGSLAEAEDSGEEVEDSEGENSDESETSATSEFIISSGNS